MPNTSIPAAAEGLPTKVNRRQILGTATMAAAASIAVFQDAHGHQIETLPDRVQRLALELSELLNRYENGELSLSVSPSNYPGRQPIRFFNIERSRQLKKEIIKDVRDVIGPSDPADRLKFLAKEIKDTAASVHPEVTDWQLWEGKGESGNNAVFFTLTGKIGA